MKKKPVIAIDGPAGAGKSTLARLLAKKLGLLYIDTGAMYRALTWKALKEAKDCEDEGAMADLLSSTRLEFVMGEGDEAVIYMDGCDVSRDIRSPEVNRWVSQVSLHPAVRHKMASLQREMAFQGGVVLDGRDIGTHVAPGADVKFFMTADFDTRVKRRYKELLEKGFDTRETEVASEMAERDRIDSERVTAPLRKAEDAILIDSTSLSVEEVLDLVLKRVRRLRGATSHVI